MAKRTKKRWEFLCWQALSKWKRQSGVCMRCGKTKDPGKLHAHHLIPKSKGTYAKLEPDNVVALCGWYCHKMWWHGQSTWEEQRDLIDKWIGLDRYQEIKLKANFSCKYDEDDYDKMLTFFKEQIAKGEKEC